MHKNIFKLVTTILVIVMGVAAITMLFLNFTKISITLSFNGETSTEEYILKGFKAAFGDSDLLGENNVGTAFSFGIFAAFFLSLLGIILAVIKLAVKKYTLVFNVSIAISFAVATLLFFLSPFMICFTDLFNLGMTGLKLSGFTTDISKSFEIGSILAGVLSILSTSVVLLEIVIDKKISE